MATLEGAFPAVGSGPPPPAAPPSSPCCRPPDGALARSAEHEGPAMLLQRGVGGRTRTSYSCRKKHKMEEEVEDGPVAKKRLLEEAAALPGPSTPGLADWALCAGPQPPAQTLLGCLPGPLMEGPCEEMEQAVVVSAEPQCEVARRRLQEIEARIIDDDEEEEEEEEEGQQQQVLLEGRGGGLPTLVLSDTLKTGLKQDFDGVLTKKIIESMSRPSMELVLWRPLPEFLTGGRAKPRTAAGKSYEAPTLADRGLPEPEPLESPFLAQPPLAQVPPALLYGAVDPQAAPEEEMEL